MKNNNNNRRWHRLTLAVALGLSACAGDDGDKPEDGWVEQDDETNGSTGAAEETAGSTGSEEEPEGVPQFDEESLAVVWFGGATVVPSTSFEGGLELVVLSADPATGVETEVCTLEFEVESATPLDDCAECEFAFDLALGAGAMVGEVAEGACEQYLPFDPGPRTESVGFGGGQIYGRDGGSWVSLGEGEFTAASGAFEFEYEAADA